MAEEVLDGQHQRVDIPPTSLWSPPPPSTAVKHGPRLLTLKKRIQAFKAKCMRKLLRILYLEHRLGGEQDHVSCESTGTSSGNRQETETCMDRACHTPRQPLQKHPLGHLGGWVALWSAEEMLDGQHQRVDIPHKGLLQKTLEEGLR